MKEVPQSRCVWSAVRAGIRFGLALAAILITGWGGRVLAVQGASPAAWREDLAFLSSEMIRLHPNLFFSITREQFDQAVARLDVAINQPGKLFTVMDRQTFSAAGNFVTDIERRTETLLVGEPTGGAPNQYGDAAERELPNSRLLFFVSTLYHQRSTAEDRRLTHKPDLPVALSSRDCFNGHDPAMEAILDFKP